MARITVEDSQKRPPTRSRLPLAPTSRARQLAQGGTPHIETTRDKPTVIALREIAAGKVGVEYLSRVHTGEAPCPLIAGGVFVGRPAAGAEAESWRRSPSPTSGSTSATSSRATSAASKRPTSSATPLTRASSG